MIDHGKASQPTTLSCCRSTSIRPVNGNISGYPTTPLRNRLCITLTALYRNIRAVPLAVDADALGNSRIDPPQPRGIIHIGSVREQDRLVAPLHYFTLPRTRSLDIPEADRTVVERANGKQSAIGAVWPVQRDTPDVNISAWVPRGAVIGNLKPVDGDGAVAMDVFVVPGDALSLVRGIPVRQDACSLAPPRSRGERERWWRGWRWRWRRLLLLLSGCLAVQHEGLRLTPLDVVEEGRILEASQAPLARVAAEVEKAATCELQVYGFMRTEICRQD